MDFVLKKGDIFSGCKIISKCGEGSFGITYYAKNPIDQPVIIKVVPSSRFSERELKGLKNYMAVAGKHPNLLQIFHIGEFENGFYYIMEAADNCGTDGEYYPATLGNLFRQDHDFPPEKAIQIIRELLGGLKFMHSANLIHRDIKPDNIIFVNNVPKLSDPGLVVELGQTTSCAGTLGFIPPEVLNNDADMDQKADIYALGKVFYCMVTGLRPRQYPQLPIDMRIEVCRQIYPALSRMCNRNPAKRFKNADEFLSGLPVKLEKPTRFEKMSENFRNWCICNREHAKLLLIFGIAAIVLLIIAAAAWLTVSVCNARRFAEYRKIIKNYTEINKDRMDLLHLQLKTFYPEYYLNFIKSCRNLNIADSKQLEKSVIYVTQLQTLLKNCAIKAVPEKPEKNTDLAKNMEFLGKAYGFLSSPLAQYLGEKKLELFKKDIAAFEKQGYLNYSGPKCGKEYLNFNNPEMVMVFVPPGAVRLPHNGKTYNIPYHFWVCKNEIISNDFTLNLGISPQKNPRSGAPVERLTWNDLLFYCYKQTLRFKELNALPPGYIIRPLNEAEWQFAAENAWLGRDVTPQSSRIAGKETSGGTSHPSGFKNPNKLGLLDIYGNVTEIVQPVEKTKMHLSNVIRGGSFLNSIAKCVDYRTEYLAYQNIPFDIGSRVALAPGNMDYFDRNFFLGGASQCAYGGKIYELIGINVATFHWHTAEHLAHLLGGKLAEFKNKQELDAVKKGIPLTGHWPTIVGGVKIDGKWVWNSDKTPISFGRFRRNNLNRQGGHLAYQRNVWLERHHEKMSVFVCEWEAAKYKNRNKDFLKRAGKHLLKRFKYQDREFILLDFPVISYAAIRCAELLGGRLACLDTPELLALAKNELKDFAYKRIRIGAYAKRSDWYWQNGKKLQTEVFVTPEISRYNIESRNNNFAVLYQNKIYDSFMSSAFLLELKSSALR